MSVSRKRHRDQSWNHALYILASVSTSTESLASSPPSRQLGDPSPAAETNSPLALEHPGNDDEVFEIDRIIETKRRRSFVSWRSTWKSDWFVQTEQSQILSVSGHRVTSRGLEWLVNWKPTWEPSCNIMILPGAEPEISVGGLTIDFGADELIISSAAPSIPSPASVIAQLSRAELHRLCNRRKIAVNARTSKKKMLAHLAAI
jgi:hypothetical protein